MVVARPRANPALAATKQHAADAKTTRLLALSHAVEDAGIGAMAMEDEGVNVATGHVQ